MFVLLVKLKLILDFFNFTWIFVLEKPVIVFERGASQKTKNLDKQKKNKQTNKQKTKEKKKRSKNVKKTNLS